MSRSYYDDYSAPSPTAAADYDEDEPEDDSGKRKVWEILSWIVLALTLILNLVVIGVLAVRRNVISVINKGNAAPPEISSTGCSQGCSISSRIWVGSP